MSKKTNKTTAKKGAAKVPFSEDKPKRKAPLTRKPLKWTLEKSEASFSSILNNMATNGMALRKATQQPGEMCHKLFYEYLTGRLDEDLTQAQKDARLARYAHATDMRAEILFDEMLEISDNQEIGKEITKETGGLYNITKETRKDLAAHRRIKLDTRKWILGKMRPEKYGDKQTVKHEGEIGTKPEIDFSKFSTEELKLYRELQRKLESK